ncbi:GntR family transcriptional regulator [Phytohabitans kaempferiae]|uniref:GntR family transcriptional regulator n=1 Tax=Phytohabitans kaempferiae TaxID=1620943 RepID=A0ABV6MHQ7_9ACTN
MTEIVFQDRWEVVQEELRRRILSGELPPGSTLPENELAKELGVSRGPVREALRALETTGLVLRRERKPSIVAPTTRADVDDLFSLRQALEEFAARTAISRNSSSLREEMAESIADFDRRIRSGASAETLVRVDIEFHELFYKWSGNGRLTGMWNSLKDPVRLMMNLSLHLSEPHWDLLLHEHQRIYTAIKDQDVDLAIDAVQSHLSRAAQRAETYVEAYLRGEMRLPTPDAPQFRKN